MVIIIIFHIALLVIQGCIKYNTETMLPVSISGPYVAFFQNSKDNGNGIFWAVGKGSNKAQFYTEHPNTILCKLKSNLETVLFSTSQQLEIHATHLFKEIFVGTLHLS